MSQLPVQVIEVVTQGPPGPGFRNRLAWALDETYALNDVVEHGGSSWYCLVGHVASADSEPDEGAEWESHWSLAAAAGDAISALPEGGDAGQVLTKQSGEDGDADWGDPPTSVPAGGTTGQVLAKQSNADGDVDWQDQAGGVAGPETSTAKELAVFGGISGDAIEGGGVLCNAGAISNVSSITIANAGLLVRDTNASHSLALVPGSDLTANRSLTFATGDADRTLTLGGNATLNGGTHSGTNTGDQTITLSGVVSGSGTGAITVTLSDVELAAIASLVSAANKIPRFTGSGTADLLDFDTDGTLAANSGTRVPSQSAVKSYVDSMSAGLRWKQPVRVATTADGAIGTAFANGQTVDGVTLATGDRILVKNQSTARNNGIYTVNASGAPTRATDADAAPEIVQASVFVSEGTANADTMWVCTNDSITLGTSDITFAQFGVGSTITISGDASGSGTTSITLTITNAALAALKALTPAANKLGYFSGASTAALTDFTVFARTLVAASSAASARTALELGDFAVLDYAGTVAADTYLEGQGDGTGLWTSLAEHVDTPTFEWDLTDPGEIKGNVPAGSIGGSQLGASAKLRVITLGAHMTDPAVELTSGVLAGARAIVPYTGTIVGYRLVATPVTGETVGDLVVDVLRKSATGGFAEAGDTIAASAKPTLTDAVEVASTTLTGWDTAVVAGDKFGVEVEIVENITEFVLELTVEVA